MANLRKSLQGRLILDSGKLFGSFFERAVVLICRHDESGSFGLVLNRPLKQSLGTSVRESLPDDLAGAPLYGGGPVQPSVLSFLKETEPQPESELLPWLVMGHLLEDLKEFASVGKEPARYRVFAGYSGWASGQLENEMKTGCWITYAASAALVFYPDPSALWRHVLREKGGFYRLIAGCPDDPSRN